MTDQTDLSRRRGLPAHLRILADRYPRTGWEAHSNFDALTRFWLDRHLMFRDLHGRLQAETRAMADRDRDPRAYAGALYRLGGTFIGQLHGHHQIEDMHYFPALALKEPRLVAAFELLDGDHKVIDPLLDAMAERMNAALRQLGEGRADPAAIGRLEEALGRFGGFLDRHLTDEEEIVVPVILEHGGGDLH